MGALALPASGFVYRHGWRSCRMKLSTIARLLLADVGSAPTTWYYMRGIDMSQAVQEILERIQHLPEEDRLVLDEQLAQLAEEEWKREADEARQLARQKGIDQKAIDEAVRKVRYAP
jgi:hypothetical protein